MRVDCRTLRLQKAGNSPGEYEDAASPLRSARRSTRSFRCALADGATEASFAGEWARLLAQSYCQGRLARRTWPGDIDRVSAMWRSLVGGGSLPWYAEEKLRSGAFSSLLGLTLEARGAWHALAVGDTCVMQVRAGAMVASFPLHRSDEFTNSPRLIGSNRAGDVDCMVATGEWQRGDQFYLVTDALAAWCLKMHETGFPQWLTLHGAAAGTHDRFRSWVATVRATGELKNDDVTLMRLSVD